MMTKDRKGFFFVLSVFLILSYIIMSLSVWVKGLETSEKAYAEIYKESNVELAVTELSPEKVGKVADMVMQRAVYDLSIVSIDTPLKKGPEGDREKYVKKAINEYFVNGTPSETNFDGAISFSKPQSSFGGWVMALNRSLEGTGVFIDNFVVSDFKVWQERFDGLNYSIKMSLSMRDKTGTTTLTRDYDVKGFVNITGYIDPAIARESGKKGTKIYRRFFFGPYSSPSDMSASKIADVRGGQGWFYGYVVNVNDASLIPSQYRHLYILKGSYNEIVNFEGYENFSAYMVTNTPSSAGTCTVAGTTKTSEKDTFNAIKYEGAKCEPSIDDATRTSKPFVIVSSSISLPTCYNLVEKKESLCALIIGGASPFEVSNNPELKYKKDGAGVFDIEKLRDFTMCGYYVLSDKAPSYLQRFFRDAYSLNSTYGIETFIIGEYASGENTFDFTKGSALDREMFGKSDTTVLVRGETGCKSEGICSSDPSTGKFGLSEDSVKEYGADTVSCNNGGARCE